MKQVGVTPNHQPPDKQRFIVASSDSRDAEFPGTSQFAHLLTHG